MLSSKIQQVSGWVGAEIEGWLVDKWVKCGPRRTGRTYTQMQECTFSTLDDFLCKTCGGKSVNKAKI